MAGATSPKPTVDATQTQHHKASYKSQPSRRARTTAPTTSAAARSLAAADAPRPSQSRYRDAAGPPTKPPKHAKATTAPHRLRGDDGQTSPKPTVVSVTEAQYNASTQDVSYMSAALAATASSPPSATPT